MKAKEILYWIIGVATMVGFLFLAYKATSKPSYFPEMNKINSTDHIEWSTDKKNILVEYSDFQCPACKNFHDFLNQFEKSSEGKQVIKKITLVFREYPLYQIHPVSLQAAYTAEAAGLQGKFWQMADLLFNTQDSWSAQKDPSDYFVNLANQLKLDKNKLKADLNSNTVKDKVTADLKSGESAAIDATPTFFLNGKKLEIGSLEEFTQILSSV